MEAASLCSFPICLHGPGCDSGCTACGRYHNCNYPGAAATAEIPSIFFIAFTPEWELQ